MDEEKGMQTIIGQTDVPQENNESEDNKISVHVAIQAYDYEIERTSSILPARRRIIPYKFRDFQDPEEIDDERDADFVPKSQMNTFMKTPRPIKVGGGRRGRPRKVPRDHAYGREEETKSASGLENKDEDAGAHGHIAVGTNTEDQQNQNDKLATDHESNLNSATSDPVATLVRPRPYKCDCGLSFQRLASLKKHKLQAHVEDETSGATAERKSDMPRPFKCTECNKRFGQKGNLKVHIRTHTGEKPFRCDFDKCRKNFCSNESLRRHKLAHLGIKLFECDVCNKKFSSNVALKEHMSRHTDSRPYECQACGKRFRQVSCYKRHMVTHSSELPHKCDVCGKGFSQNIYLKSHMRSHTGEKPYECNICGKAFAHASDKTRHQTVHTGEKKYACSVCGSKFSDPSTCRRHVREHSGQKPYPCHLCGDTFKRAGQLKAHLNKKHMNYKEEGSDVQFTDGTVQGLEQLTQGTPTIIFNNEDMVEDEQQLITRLIEQHGGNKILQGDQIKIIQPGQSLLSTNDKQYILASESVSSGQEQIVVDPTIIEQIQSQLDPSQTQLTTDDGQPLQVAYQIIHDDENQQIVEIQYQAVGTQEEEPVVDGQQEVGQDQQNNEYAQQVSQVDVPLPIIENTQQTLTTLSSNIEQETPMDEAEFDNDKDDSDVLSSEQTTQFVANPDFNSQDYYNWLSNFTDMCKSVKVPLEVELFQRISQVHKTLSDILATPKGVLSNRDNFKILMNISRDLNDIINGHLKHVLSSLDEQDV